jgi:XTP/dITP diphosphohydrolase
MPLILATQNRGKVFEMQAVVAELGIFVQPYPNDSPPFPEEIGQTFAENARAKAEYAWQITGYPALADDSGLAVDCLDGEPGIHSARYAGSQADDAERIEFLLRKIREKLSEGRDSLPLSSPIDALCVAHFVCALALRLKDRTLLFEDRADGLILANPRGIDGFGYDPIFYYPPLKCTFAELNREQKYQVSHRGKALRQLLNYLKRSGETIRMK